MINSLFHSKNDRSGLRQFTVTLLDDSGADLAVDGHPQATAWDIAAGIDGPTGGSTLAATRCSAIAARRYRLNHRRDALVTTSRVFNYDVISPTDGIIASAAYRDDARAP